MENLVDMPWAWYVSRIAAMLGFSMLYLSMFFGIALKSPLLGKMIKPVYSYGLHCWISLLALILAGAHGVSLLFDRFLNFNAGNIFVPYYPMTAVQLKAVDPDFLFLGLISFYLMVLLVVSSFLKQYISQGVWRAVHFLNVGLYIATLFHALYLGTDLKGGLARDVFIYANLFLAVLLASNLANRFLKSIFSDNTFIDNKNEHTE